MSTLGTCWPAACLPMQHINHSGSSSGAHGTPRGWWGVIKVLLRRLLKSSPNLACFRTSVPVVYAYYYTYVNSLLSCILLYLRVPISGGVVCLLKFTCVSQAWVVHMRKAGMSLRESDHVCM